eukprot:TRINITY_DN5779_c0_g1_i1.p1 TRINITY_DN5779_c0_g1~~TRINITY_DN5779_c0_g1_i1.p1  ORF type:complete len:217 (+),score=28.56 TRINITY_DN5779_c0_g1_i1:144-794(+)
MMFTFISSSSKLKVFDLDLVFPTSPHKMDGESWHYKWWSSVPQQDWLTSKDQSGFKSSLDYLHDFIQKEEKENGAFDGVLGFSQGGIIASLLILLCKPFSDIPIQSKETPPNPNERIDNWPTFNFKFAIIFSAFQTTALPAALLYERISTLTAQNLQPLPTLHVWGNKDELVLCKHSISLSKLFPNADTYEHQGRHDVPSNAPMKNAIINFLNKTS